MCGGVEERPNLVLGTGVLNWLGTDRSWQQSGLGILVTQHHSVRQHLSQACTIGDTPATLNSTVCISIRRVTGSC